MTFRKSWTEYVKNIVGVAFWLALLGVVMSYDGRWIASWARGGNDPAHARIAINILMGLIGLAILPRVVRFFWLKSFRIDVSDDLVTVRYGLLPWTKFARSWDGDQMHQCLVDTGGFIGWITKTGTLQIVGSEGSTHKYSMRGIGQAEAACGAINMMRRDARRREA